MTTRLTIKIRGKFNFGIDSVSAHCTSRLDFPTPFPPSYHCGYRPQSSHGRSCCGFLSDLCVCIDLFRLPWKMPHISCVLIDSIGENCLNCLMNKYEEGRAEREREGEQTKERQLRNECTCLSVPSALISITSEISIFQTWQIVQKFGMDAWWMDGWFACLSGCVYKSPLITF